MDMAYSYSPINELYKNKELSKARDYLSEGVKHTALWAYHYSLRPTGKKKCPPAPMPNVWEGERGLMEHLLQGFPMPPRVGTLMANETLKSVSDEANSSDLMKEKNFLPWKSSSNAVTQDSELIFRPKNTYDTYLAEGGLTFEPLLKKQKTDDFMAEVADAISFNESYESANHRSALWDIPSAPGCSSSAQQEPIAATEFEGVKSKKKNKNKLKIPRPKMQGAKERNFWGKMERIHLELQKVKHFILEAHKNPNHSPYFACLKMKELYKRILVADRRLRCSKEQKEMKGYGNYCPIKKPGNPRSKKGKKWVDPVGLLDPSITFQQIESFLREVKLEYRTKMLRIIDDVDPFRNVFGKILPAVGYLFVKKNNESHTKEKYLLFDENEEIMEEESFLEDNSELVTSPVPSSGRVNVKSKIRRECIHTKIQDGAHSYMDADFIESENQHWERLQDLFSVAHKCDEEVIGLLEFSQVSLQRREAWIKNKDNQNAVLNTQSEIGNILYKLLEEESESDRRGYCKDVSYGNLEFESQTDLVRSLEHLKKCCHVMQGNFRKVLTRFRLLN